MGELAHILLGEVNEKKLNMWQICDKYNISIRKLYSELESVGYVKSKQKKRVKYFKARELKKWKVHNKVLLGLLLVSGEPFHKIAEDIGVSTRAIERWVYEEAYPNETNLKKVCDYFGYPPNVLFYNQDRK